MKISDILELVEFSYKINEDNTFSFVDLCGANLGRIEDEKYSLTPSIATVIVDRLGLYLEDYIFFDIRERYSSLGYGNIERDSNIDEYIELLKEHEDDFKGSLNILEYLNDPDKIDVTELYERKDSNNMTLIEQHKVTNIETNRVSFEVTIDDEEYFVVADRIDDEEDSYKVYIDKNNENYSTFYMDSSGGRADDDRAEDDIETIVVDILLNSKMIVEF